MGAIQPTITVDTGAGDAVIVPVNKLSVTWKLGQPESISYESRDPQARGLADVGAAIIDCSFGNGVSARLLSAGAQLVNDLPPTVSETGSSIGQALATTHIGRLSGQQIKLIDAFNGRLGAIKTYAGDTLIDRLPDAQGIAYTSIGVDDSSPMSALIAFTYRIDPGVAQLLLDIDVNRDNALHATQVIAERLASTVDPQQAQFYVDSGAQEVVVGNLGGGPGVAFQPDVSQPQPILLATQYQQQAIDQCRSCSFQGGDTHHGIPDGGRLTDIQTINNQASDATGNFRSGLPVISIYVNRDRGGVYYYPGDGALHAMSQAMGVTDLWYDETIHMLFAATDAGVYQGAADPGVTDPWQRLGGMALQVVRLAKDGGLLYALVEFQNGGARHVLRYPGSSSGYGYDGWDDMLTFPGLVDMGVCNGTIYLITQSMPNIVLFADGDQRALPNSGAYPVGFDAISTDGFTVDGLVVRTDQGSSALYYVAAGAKTFTPMNTDTSLVDRYGAPVMVNEIRACSTGEILFSNGSVSVALLAATSVGVYVTADATGATGWRFTGGQSNIGDIDVQHVAVSPGRLWLGHMLTRVWAINDTSIYLSPNGTVNWVDVIAKPLDAGPAFYEAWRQQYGVFPDNVADTIAYRGYTLTRVVNGIGEYDYIMINEDSTAPAGAHRDSEISEISTPALLSEVRASQVLCDGMVRFLGWTSRPQTILVVQSMADDTSDALFVLRPTHDVSATGAIVSTVVNGGDGGQVVTLGAVDIAGYVLEHTISYDADQDPGAVSTTTRIGTLCLEDRTDPTAVTADLWYAVSRQQLYAGHRSR